MGVSGGSTGGFLLFWKPDAEKDYFRFQLPNIARDMDLHPDGLQVATAHHDRHVRITSSWQPRLLDPKQKRLAPVKGQASVLVATISTAVYAAY